MDENVVQSFQEPKFSRMWLKNPNLKECYVAVVCKAETLEAEALELVSQLTTGETVRQLKGRLNIKNVITNIWKLAARKKKKRSHIQTFGTLLHFKYNYNMLLL